MHHHSAQRAPKFGGASGSLGNVFGWRSNTATERVSGRRRPQPNLALVAAVLTLGLSACAASPAPTASDSPRPAAQSPTLSQPLRVAAAQTASAQSTASDAAASPTGANVDLFDLWLRDFRKDAVKAGVRGDVYDTATDSISPNARVIEATRVQPEFVRPIWEYIEKAVSDYRIKRGRELLIAHKALFDEIEKKYGVQRQYLVAIWGMESAFGSFMGDIYAIEALATLGYKGRRTDYGRSQMIAALKILQNGYATRDLLHGSWAGAMGQTQFIPTTYLDFAVDHNGDGKRDIWTDLGDVFASTSNYLSKSKWKPGQKYGQEVTLSANFDYALAEYTIVKSVSEWRKLGVSAVPGQSLDPLNGEVGSIIIPAGHKGPAFLVMNNFRSIMRYNNATSYALAVGVLAERLVGGPGITAAWPVSEQPLTRTANKQVQSLLSSLGYATGEPDGIIGAQTRSAVRMYQKDKGLPADGFVTQGLLNLLQADSR